MRVIGTKSLPRLSAGLLGAVFLCAAIQAQEPPDPAVARSLQRLGEISSRWSAEWEVPSAARAERGTASAGPAARQMAKSEDPEVRRRAVEALTRGSDVPTLRDLLWALGDEDAGVRAVALKKIAPLSPTALLEGALDILLENDADSVYALDRALPELPSGVSDEFARVFRDANQPIPLRRAAAYALGKLRAPGIAGELADGTADPEATFAVSCALALFALRDTTTITRWIPLAQHRDISIAWLAIQALTELGGREAFSALANFANGTTPVDPQLVSVALNGISAWPLTDSVPVLIDCMYRNPGYRHIAAALLQARTGVPLGNSADEWKNWYENGLAPPVDNTPLTEDAPTELLQIAEFVPPDLRGRGF